MVTLGTWCIDSVESLTLVWKSKVLLDLTVVGSKKAT